MTFFASVTNILSYTDIICRNGWAQTTVLLAFDIISAKPLSTELHSYKTLGGPSLAVSLLWQGDYVVNPMLYVYLTFHNIFPYPCTLDRLLVLLSAKRNFRIWFHILRRQFFLLDMLFMLKYYIS